MKISETAYIPNTSLEFVYIGLFIFLEISQKRFEKKKIEYRI